MSKNLLIAVTGQLPTTFLADLVSIADGRGYQTYWSVSDEHAESLRINFHEHLSQEIRTHFVGSGDFRGQNAWFFTLRHRREGLQEYLSEFVRCFHSLRFDNEAKGIVAALRGYELMAKSFLSNSVLQAMFGDGRDAARKLANWSQHVIVVPATEEVISRIVYCRGSDFMMRTLRSVPKGRTVNLFAEMNADTLADPAVQMVALLLKSVTYAEKYLLRETIGSDGSLILPEPGKLLDAVLS